MPDVVRLLLALVAAAVLVGGSAWLVTAYRRLAGLRDRVERAGSNLEAARERRSAFLADLLPPLEAVEGLEPRVRAQLAALDPDRGVATPALHRAQAELRQAPLPDDLRARLDEFDRLDAIVRDRERLHRQLATTYEASLARPLGRLLRPLLSRPGRQR